MGDKQEDITMDESGGVNDDYDNDVKNVEVIKVVDDASNNKSNDQDEKSEIMISKSINVKEDEKKDEKKNSNQTDTTTTEQIIIAVEQSSKDDNKNESNNPDECLIKDIEVINSKKPEYVPPEIIYHYHTLDEMFPDIKMERKTVENKKVKRKKRKISVDNNNNNNNRNMKKSIAIVLSSEVEVDQSTQSKPSKSHLELLSSLQEEHQESNSKSFNNEEKYNMDFFSEMHEDQDPETIELVKTIHRKWLSNDLQNFSQYEKEMKNNLQNHLSKKWENESQSFLKEIKAWKQHMSDKQERQRTSLAETFQQSLTSKEDEAREALNYVTKKTNEQIESVNRNYQRYPQWNQELDQRKMGDLKKIQAKSHVMQKEIRAKLDQYRITKEADFKKNQLKLREHHQKRKEELTAMISKSQVKLVEKHKVQRSYLQKLQSDKFQRMIEDIKKERNDLLSTGFEGNHELDTQNNDSSIQHYDTVPNKSEHTDNITGAAVVRYKRRQAVFAKDNSQISLHLQIHNEGLRISWRSDIHDGISDKKLQSDFLPWGFKARQILHTVVCGEIPVDESMDNSASIHGFLQGGQIKCVISDVRGQPNIDGGNGDMKNEQKLKLEDFVAKLHHIMEANAKAEMMAEGLLRKSDQELRYFQEKLYMLKSQTSRMLYQDASRKQISPENQRKLSAAFAKYEGDIVSAEKKRLQAQSELSLSQKKNADATQAYMRAQEELKQFKSGTNKDDIDILTTIASLNKVITKRQSKCDVLSNDNPSDRSKVKSICLVLRPTKTRINKHFRHNLKESNVGIIPKTRNLDLIRAEQLMLLALHPIEENLLTAPTEQVGESKPWIEPGCHLMLEIPSNNRNDTILPLAQQNKVFHHLHTESSSSKGRQASTLLSRQRYKCFPADGEMRSISLLLFGKEITDEELMESYDYQLKLECDELKRKQETSRPGVETKMKVEIPPISYASISSQDRSFPSHPPIRSGPDIFNNDPSRPSSLPISNIPNQYEASNKNGVPKQINPFDQPPAPHVQSAPHPYPGQSQYSAPSLQYRQMNNFGQPPQYRPPPGGL